LGIDADGNDNTAASLRATTNIANDFAARQAAIDSEMILQPFQKCWPGATPRDFDRGASVGIAQTHKSEVEVQCIDQHVGEPGGDGRRVSSNPRRWDGRQCYEVPQRSSQPQGVSLGTHRRWLVIIALSRTGVSREFRARTGQEEQ